MREIKFRGKRLDNGKWIYGDLYHADEQTCICDWSIHPHTVDNFAVYPSTVGQFTGLLDKNGKEIYEGDIIEARNSQDKNKCRDIFVAVGDVRWNDKSMCIDVGGDILCTLCACDNFYAIETIGNIYDNPELEQI